MPWDSEKGSGWRLRFGVKVQEGFLEEVNSELVLGAWQHPDREKTGRIEQKFQGYVVHLCLGCIM